jgi:amino acid adenylation domain-containing protein
LPLSFAQTRLWFLEQFEPGDTAYAIPAAARLKGSLNKEALQQALNEIVRRHESLRTSFIGNGGRPVQVIREAAPVHLDTVDLTGLSDDEREPAVNSALRQEAERGFDLERGPLFRAQLLRLADDHHVLIISMHHIISDGWSVGILIRELQHLYEAFLHGEPSALPELPLQYVDYAAWQREFLGGENLRRQLDYWKERLAGLKPLNLSPEQQRDTRARGAAEVESLELSEELSARLRGLSRREGVTLFMTLLAAFKLLLARHSGQEDVAVGTPIAGRLLPEWEGLIGFFVNTLVMRTTLAGSPTFCQLLCRERETALGAYAHQDVPFEKLVEELQPDRNLNSHPFFDIFFNHVNVPLINAKLTGLEIEMLDVTGGASKFPLTLYTRDDDRRIALRAAYSKSLFNRERIRMLLDQYQEVLSQIVERPDDTIASYSLVTGRTWSLFPDPKAEIAEPHFEPVTETFDRRVAESPHNIAVTQGGREWSYEELSRSARVIARTLVKLGLRPGQTVVVCGEKSFGLIAGMLATGLSGGVLFTLDRRLPESRQQVMFDIAGVKYILYAGSPRAQDAWMFERGGVDILTLEKQSGSLMAHNGRTIGQENLETFESAMLSSVPAAAAAYIFFTSGTTGVPKAVLGSHKGLSHFITWQREEFGVGPGDKVAQLTGLSFDVVLRDIFLPLTSGATLCLPEDEDEAISGQVLGWLERERVSVLHTVPSLAESWLRSPLCEPRVTSLRILFFAGEPLASQLVAAWREATSSRCQIVNLYGPTETTLAKCFYRVPLDCPAGPQPVGKPIPQTQVLIFRDGHRLCGVGEIGEVVIRTPFRSLGYVNGAQADRRRFVKNPYRDAEQDLLYHTGDLGRYQSDGSIQLLGRIDDQFKIRGHRIEPAEIEYLLREHPAIASAVVVARTWTGEDKRLVAYVTFNDDSRPSLTELRSYLRRRLPEYMMPAVIMPLPALPLTPNGKIDRERLPEPEEQPAEEGDEQPRDEIEGLLAGIWSEVLGLKLVGRNQNFFDLGGHSLMATQVVSRVREIFHVDLPVRTLFSAPTISGMAEAVAAVRAAHDRGSQRPQLRRVARGPLLPLSFAQQCLWFIDQLEPGSAAYVIPAAVTLSGELNQEALRAALSAIARRHETLRTRFVSTDGTPMQIIDAEPNFEFRFEDLSGEAHAGEAAAHALLRQETRRSFDLSREHLFRALLIRLSATEHILLMTVHHIVSDAWSMGVLLKGFKAFYQSYCEGSSAALPELPVQYADYAAWQRDYLRGETLERQLSYWRKQLKGAEPLELPADHPRPPVQTYRGAVEPFTLPSSLVGDIRHLGRREGCTLFMTLLAAFQILLSKYSGQRDVLVGTPIAGRIHPDLEGLIGFFVNTLVLRTEMHRDSTLLEILRRVREAALAAFAHQEVPFEKLIEDLQPARDASRSPLFQVMFIFQHSSRKEEEFGGLRIKPLEVASATAKFDLTLTVLGDSEELNCVIEYNTDLFERERILRLIRHFKVVLEAMAVNPDQRFSTLGIIASDEREKVLRLWNSTEVDYTGEQNVARLFELQAEKTPDRVAFIDGERRLSYGELNRRANRLAHRLSQRDLREESTAAVCVRRSMDMMVALLAVVKAGGVYVPIDPELPSERMAMMLSDSKAGFILTEHSLSGRVSGLKAEVICLDSDWHEIETYDSSNLPHGPGGDAALYLIYTSGSTGRPKGVVGTQGATINRFRWMWDAFPFEAGEVCSLKTSLSFVDSVWECFGPLLAGVPAVMIPESIVSDTEALVSRLKQERVTRIVLVPSLLESIVENYSNLGELVPDLRFWVCSGEALSSQLAKSFHAAVPGGLLVNLYGCSEVAGDVTYHAAERTASIRPVPIGRPVANTQIYILDEQMNPCGVGLPGQVYVGGAHLARGYWERPGETADRFVPNPFATGAGQRLYRTGDLGRYASNGEIEYLGRLDYQLKVRGYRIESGEIESVLAQHPNVRMIQVVAADAGSSGKKLVAYVVLNEAGESAIRDLYDYAARILPSYMIPSAFVPLEKFSLLPNGKIDRRALPAVGRTHTLSVGAVAAPSTPVEAALVEIWREVLDLDQVGIYDNFFDLGGHSLALVRLRARIESRLGRSVSLPDLFTYPTIAALSRHLLDADTENDMLAAVRQRSARQKESSRRRRQGRMSRRIMRQEITS